MRVDNQPIISYLCYGVVWQGVVLQINKDSAITLELKEAVIGNECLHIMDWRGWGLYVSIATWIFCLAILSARAILRHRRGVPADFIQWPPPPLPPDQWSYITWLIYCFGLLSQISPRTILTKVLPRRYGQWFYDTYVLCWLLFAYLALLEPAVVTTISFLYVWWLVEYLSTFAYELVYITSLPVGLRRQVQFPVAYRMLINEIIAYVTVMVFAAAVYHANAPYFELEEDGGTIRNALYVSIITMSTVGFGDLTPHGCLRWFAAGQALFGIFIVIVAVATVVGRISGFIGADNHEEAC